MIDVAVRNMNDTSVLGWQKAKMVLALAYDGMLPVLMPGHWETIELCVMVSM